MAMARRGPLHRHAPALRLSALPVAALLLLALTLQQRQPAPALTPPGGPPTSDELLKALGRELWVVGDELLTIGARIKGGAPLGGSGISFRNAADLMLDGNWEDVMGELETAAVSCMDFLPYERFEGIVNLFSYYEPVPQCEWYSARNSLLGLSDALRDSQRAILRDLEGAYRAETDDSLTFVVERLDKAAQLFEPGGFYMPPKDPRDKVAREGRGRPREPEARPFPWANGPPDEEAYREKLRQEQRRRTLRGEVVAAVQAAGGRAPTLLAQVDQQLAAAEAAASPETQRRTTLRRLVRDLHPDRNPGSQEEVRPVFAYVQGLRSEDK